MGIADSGASGLRVPIYLALSGWGYDDQEPGSTAVILTGGDSEHSQRLEGWLAVLRDTSESLLSYLLERGVSCDEDYVRARGDLPIQVRDEIDQVRFDHLVQGLDVADPSQLKNLLRISPDWLLSLPVEELVHLTVRVRNVFLKNGVSAVWQIAALGDSIWSLAEFGEKSVICLSESIVATVQKNPRGYAEWDRSSPSILKHNSSTFSATPRGVRLVSPASDPVVSTVAYTSLWLAVHAAVSDLSARDCLVAKERFGYTSAPATLEEIGSRLGITRERARQLEARVLRHLRSKTWLGEIEPRIDRLFSQRKEPLYLELLAAEDPWFEGFEAHLVFLRTIIEKVAETPFFVWPLSGRLIVSRVAEEGWADLVRSVRASLEQQLAAQLSPVEVNLILQSIAATSGCAELMEPLRASLADQLHFVRDRIGGLEYLGGVGRNLRAIVTAILEEAADPLTLRQIRERYTARTGEDAVDGSLRAAIRDVGAFPFRGRKYGLTRHVHLQDDEIVDVLAEIEDILASGAVDRQWHCSEISDNLLDRRPDLPDEIDLYSVNVILHKSEQANYLGRFVWTWANSSYCATSDRIDIADLCVSVLSQAGGPLTSRDLHNSVRTLRGLNSACLFMPNPRMTRVAPGNWGLVDRDFVLDAPQRARLLDQLHSILSERGRGLHASEIRRALQWSGMGLHQALTDYMVVGLAQIDDRFRIGRGQIVGLAQWDSSGRLTVRGAIHKAVQEAGEIVDAEFIYSRVLVLVERDVERFVVNAGMKQLGYSFVESSGTWISESEAGEVEPL